MRYFQFTTACGHGNWQDTAFIAATSDADVIASVFEELEKPLEQRKFIAGPIDYGNDGVNRNGSHWFSWHFIPNEWELVEQAIEVCDGCPFTDLDSDTAYWVGNIGFYCPWSGAPVREVEEPVNVRDPSKNITFKIYPNPSSEDLFIEINQINSSLVLYNASGQAVWRTQNTEKKLFEIDVSNMPSGIYLLNLQSREYSDTRKVVILRPS